MNYTEEELSALTEEERSYLLDDDQVEEEQEDKAVDDEAQEEVQPEAAEESATPEKEEEQEEEAVEDEEVEQKQPTVDLQGDIDAFSSQLKHLDDGRQKLLKSFEDGEIEVAEYQKALEESMNERMELKFKLQKAELTHEAMINESNRRWNEDAHEFLIEHKDILDNQVKIDALAMIVGQVTANEANANLTNRAMFKKAYKQYCEAFGIDAQKKVESPAPKKQVKSQPEIPPTLGAVPASSINDTDGGKYAMLDRLANTDLEQYEKKLASMPEDEKDRYLMGA